MRSYVADTFHESMSVLVADLNLLDWIGTRKFPLGSIWDNVQNVSKVQVTVVIWFFGDQFHWEFHKFWHHIAVHVQSINIWPKGHQSMQSASKDFKTWILFFFWWFTLFCWIWEFHITSLSDQWTFDLMGTNQYNVCIIKRGQNHTITFLANFGLLHKLVHWHSHLWLGKYLLPEVSQINLIWNSFLPLFFSKLTDLVRKHWAPIKSVQIICFCSGRP